MPSSLPPLGSLINYDIRYELETIKVYPWRATAWSARADRQAANSQLRTGTDKGNPTV